MPQPIRHQKSRIRHVENSAVGLLAQVVVELPCPNVVAKAVAGCETILDPDSSVAVWTTTVIG